jgi:hypothetical protein
MNAVISGKCKKCKRTYYMSFGHPKWFDDHVNKAKRSLIHDSFEKLRKAGVCPDCGKQHYAKFASDWKANAATHKSNR